MVTSCLPRLAAHLLHPATLCLLAMGCRPREAHDSKGGTVGSDSAARDTGDVAANDRPTDWNELPIDDEGLGTLVEVGFQAAYGLYGYEGWGGPHTVRNEFFYGAGYHHPLSLTTHTGDDYCIRHTIDNPDPSIDLGRDLPFLVGDIERNARRTR